MLVLDLFNEMDVANCLKVTVTVPETLRLLPSVVVAVIVAVPAEIAFTLPLLFTVATEVLLDFHATVLLFAYSGVIVAESSSVSPLNIVELSRLSTILEHKMLASSSKIAGRIL